MNKVAQEIRLNPPEQKIGLSTFITRLSSTDEIYIRLHKNKLPGCMQLLEENIESVEDFQIRKIQDTIDLFKRNGKKNISLKHFLKYHRYKQASERVIEEIKRVLNTL